MQRSPSILSCSQDLITHQVFRKGMVLLLNLLKKEEHLRYAVSVFSDRDATKDQISVADKAFMIALCGK